MTPYDEFVYEQQARKDEGRYLAHFGWATAFCIILLILVPILWVRSLILLPFRLLGIK